MSDLFRRGYGVLDLNSEHAQCEIYHVATVTGSLGGVNTPPSRLRL